MKYVAGLYFNQNEDQLVLIRKNRPVWQAGKLNAIGGKIEVGESSHDAMIREFKEETGVTYTDWRLFCVLTGENTNTYEDFEVNFFVGFGDLNEPRSLTDEKIEVNYVDNLDDVMHNLKWLIPMALDKNKVVAMVTEHP